MKLLKRFVLFCSILVLSLSFSTVSQAANSENFKFNTAKSSYGFTDPSNPYNSDLLFEVKKGYHDIHFGLVLDDSDGATLPITLSVRLSPEWGGAEFSYKKITFKKVGQAVYTASYTGTVDPGKYYIEIDDTKYGGYELKGNGFVYYSTK
ncbi:MULTISPECIES: hypothetical protein [Bacillus]|uniref:hypothetical protein n=1 Tax=Bacillus TaxID=1386 RepID=UPI000B5DA565|nr:MULTISPECIES: hypothetical protein [Bacillus]OXB99479.1 hypothetical protein CGQ22_07625 [Bacillus sp. M13(2017)]QCY61394.1 hypothetical protein FHE73_11550 [Bacillus thuringiensis]